MTCNFNNLLRHGKDKVGQISYSGVIIYSLFWVKKKRDQCASKTYFTIFPRAANTWLT